MAIRQTKKGPAKKRAVKVREVPVYVKQEPNTAREVLDIIDAFLTREARELREEQRNLWYVLSALRGPDTLPLDSDFKEQTTVQIRRAALPKVAEGWDRNDYFHIVHDHATFGPAVPFNVPHSEAGFHFIDHAFHAREALGL